MNKSLNLSSTLIALPLLALSCSIGCAKQQDDTSTTTAPATPQAAPATPSAATTAATATPPSWQKDAVIYCVNPEIFSSQGLAGVTAQIPRIKALGATVIWMMPFQPIGQAGNFAGAPRISGQSRYDMTDLKGIDPKEGTHADLTALLAAAHAAGMHVIMDVAINQTSWDSPLIEQHPEYYYHTDSNPQNVNSIDYGFPNGFRDKDIAGVDIRTDKYGAQTYMKGVLQYWLDAGFDGFRFDSGDSPKGDTRDLGQPYAQSLYTSLNPDGKYMWLGEENTPELADKPYTLDYDWDVAFYSQYGPFGNFLLQDTAKSGTGVATLEQVVNADAPGGPGLGRGGFPAGYQHMIMLMDWDTDIDYALCGGFPQVLDAAAFNLTIPGVPLVYNGEEVGNDHGGNNTHTPIDWSSPNAAKFSNFYKSMLALRKANPALSDGTLNWTSNSNKSVNVATYQRLSGSNECYVEVNFSNKPQTGTLAVPGGTGAWKDISPTVAPGKMAHPLPSAGKFTLAPYDYAVFSRTAANVPSAAPASQAGTGSAPAAAPVPAAPTGAAGTAPGTSGGTKNLHGTQTSITSPGVFNLDTLGATDWAAWGNNATDFDHKASGGMKISNATAVGGSLNPFDSQYLGFTYTGGTPDATATGETKGYYNQGSVGDGIQFTAPATTTPQTLTVFVGGYASGGTLTATLSDNSAPAYTDVQPAKPGLSYYNYYTLTYKAAKPGQTLTVKWIMSAPGTNVTLYAAALK